ncbi:MAG: Mrp/NBP35 family ATP-binding protein [Pirellulales bacterium]|nr:Mrp/NBP35 family ATP-binding protein [Pirellulales bacterium]
MSAAPITAAQVHAVIDEFPDPETGRGLKIMEQIKEVDVRGDKIHVTVGLATHSGAIWGDTLQAIRDRLRERLPGAPEVSIDVVQHVRPAEPIGAIGLTAKSVIAVGSGKGGVGKSTIAASLAVALKTFGSKVGLMDADVYGPSIPHLLGLEGQPFVQGGKLQPIDAGGMPVMSMGFLVPPGEAVVWRGPMLHGAITLFLRDTSWGDLDYLIIDMPPGTGDIALTLSQSLPLTGAVVVCTPQDVALIDAVKAIAMFRKVNIPVLGVVENMSYFLCPDNGKRYDIFGSGGARAKAEELQVPFLGEVPIQIPVRERGDAGQTAGNLADIDSAAYFERIAYNLVRNLAAQRAAEPPLPTLSVL